jgi:glyoxylase-like metal-dependent hydrolase (beta-lactamase superfamily II)
VIDRGQAEFVGMDHEIEDWVRFEPLPGHTPGHVGLRVGLPGADAILTGDMMHHPLQVVYPHWCSGFCSDAALARATRAKNARRVADTPTLVAPAHFPAPTFGYVRTAGEAYRFVF